MARDDHCERPSDDLLIQHVSRGCAQCFASLFHRYFREVYSLAFGILRDKAESEDILQEVFLAVYLQRERYDPARGTVRTWILQFAYFKSLLRRRYLRIRRCYQEEEEAEARELRSRPAPALLGLSAAECARCVETAIAAINSKQRRVIELVHFDGYTLRECSEIMGESLANTRNYYYRGLQALRDYLQVRLQRQRASEALVTDNVNACATQS
jgi:RNA polymerase sigma-70 factor (ECF subfamily)